MTNKKDSHFIQIILISVLTIVLIGLVSFQNFYKKGVGIKTGAQTASMNKSPKPTEQIGKENSQIAYELFLTSPNNKYYLSLALTNPDNPEYDSYCYYKIRGSGEEEVSIPHAFDKTIACHPPEMGSFSVPGLLSLQNKGLAVEAPLGSISVYNFSTKQSSIYSYDPQSARAKLVNKDFSRWLFLTKIDSQSKNTTYQVLDQNKKLLKELTVNNNDRGALYDEVNDGFLFISRIYTINKDGAEDVSVSFDYFNNKSLELKYLLTTDPAKAPGRGCDSETIVPASNEIVLTRGCLTVSEKYLGDDNNIHIPL